MEKDPGLEIHSSVVTYITWVFVVLFCFFGELIVCFFDTSLICESFGHTPGVSFRSKLLRAFD